MTTGITPVTGATGHLGANLVRRPLPRLRMSPLLMAALAEVTDKAKYRIFPNLPRRFTPAAVRLLQIRRQADHDKAKQE